MGCLRFQGYYFSRPVPMADVRQVLTDTANTDNIRDHSSLLMAFEVVGAGRYSSDICQKTRNAE